MLRSPGLMPRRKAETEIELSALLGVKGEISLTPGAFVALNGDRLGVVSDLPAVVSSVTRVNITAPNAARLIASAASQLRSGKVEGVILEGVTPEVVIYVGERGKSEPEEADLPAAGESGIEDTGDREGAG